jgi:hypothetical protein
VICLGFESSAVDYRRRKMGTRCTPGMGWLYSLSPLRNCCSPSSLIVFSSDLHIGPLLCQPCPRTGRSANRFNRGEAAGRRLPKGNWCRWSTQQPPLPRIGITRGKNRGAAVFQAKSGHRTLIPALGHVDCSAFLACSSRNRGRVA